MMYLKLFKARFSNKEAEIISPKSEIRKIYGAGRGSIKMRAIWKKETARSLFLRFHINPSPQKLLHK